MIYQASWQRSEIPNPGQAINVDLPEPEYRSADPPHYINPNLPLGAFWDFGFR